VGEQCQHRPDPVTLRIPSGSITRPTAQTPHDDYSFFGVGRVQHSYDLDTQDEMKIVSTLLGYGNAYSASRARI